VSVLLLASMLALGLWCNALVVVVVVVGKCL